MKEKQQKILVLLDLNWVSYMAFQVTVSKYLQKTKKNIDITGFVIFYEPNHHSDNSCSNMFGLCGGHSTQCLCSFSCWIWLNQERIQPFPVTSEELHARSIVQLGQYFSEEISEHFLKNQTGQLKEVYFMRIC